MSTPLGPSSSAPLGPSSSTPQYEHVWLSLQWHAGFVGMGKGWDDKMVAEIQRLGQAGFEMVAVNQQKDPTLFILFFKRRVS